jgi:hypothetical protein
LEASTPTETTPKRPRDAKDPRTYKEAVTSIKVAIFKETS